jgi:hypothetical protein
MVQSDELGDRELKASYWYLTHKQLIRKLFIIGLIIINLGFLIPLGFGLVGYIKELPQSSVWANDIKTGSINWVEVHQQIKPKSLVISRTETVTRSAGAYDIIIWVKNPNPQWFAAEVDVTVLLAGNKSEPQPLFILPNEEKVVVVSNMRIPNLTNITQETARASFNVNSWQRVEDLKNYQLPIFEITDTTAQNLGDQYTQTRVVGHLSNRSLAGYGVVNLTVVLWSGQKPIGVAMASLQKVTLNEGRTFDVRFAQKYLNISNITVSASANNLFADNVLDK